MKKSEMYKNLQYIVLRDSESSYDFMLEALRELMTQEDFMKFSEEQEEKKNEAVGD